MIFEKYDIPYFMDSRKDADIKPVIRLVNSVFRIILDNFEREDILSLLKTRLTANSSDEINDFEGYAYIWNINNSGFKNEFTQNPSGFSEKFTKADEKALKSAEKVRRSVVEPLIKFKNDIKDKTGKEISTLLYRLLEDMGVPDALRRLYDEFTALNEDDYAAEQIRVWELLMDALDKTVAVIGDNILSAKRYYELLSKQIRSINFAEIPRKLDCVTVTTAQRVRISSRKAAFVIGCTDGVFPAAPKSTGLFSSYEQKLLTLNDLNFVEDYSSASNLETYMAYCCITSVSDKLFITYPTLNLKGEKFKPSQIIDETAEALPKIGVLNKTAFESDKSEHMLALKPALRSTRARFSAETILPHSANSSIIIPNISQRQRLCAAPCKSLRSGLKINKTPKSSSVKICTSQPLSSKSSAIVRSRTSATTVCESASAIRQRLTRWNSARSSTGFWSCSSINSINPSTA